MTEKAPTLTPEAEAARAARLAREAAALRENLRRRKAQARTRAALPENGAAGANDSPCDKQSLES